jgi:hypothetical protein
MLTVVYADSPLCSVFQISAYAECRYADCRYTEGRYADCRYAECRYAECHYAECHGATNSDIFKGTLVSKFYEGSK